MTGIDRFEGRRNPRRRSRAALMVLLLALSILPLPALAAMKLEGDPSALKLTVSEVPRQRVMAVLAARFKLTLSGKVADGRDPVSGIFRGDLGDVLAGLLATNNFLIVYEGGRPAKILLSEKGEAASPVDPSMRAFQQGGGTVIGGVRYDNPDAQMPVDPNAQNMGQAQYMPPKGSGLGRPPQYDPDSGAQIDPATGLPIDPATGLPIDPATGQPIEPSAGQTN